MRDRRCHLAGSRWRRSSLSPPRRRRHRLAGLGPRDRRASPRRPEAVHRAAAARRRSRGAADRLRDPNRNAYSVPEAPKSPDCGHHFCVHWVAEGLDAPSLADSRRRRRPRLRRAGPAGRRTRPPGREREARLARAEERRPPRRRQRQDRHLPRPDRRRTLRLRGAGPRPGHEGAPAAAPPARLPRPRQRLQRLRVPGHEARSTTSR